MLLNFTPGYQCRAHDGLAMNGKCYSIPYSTRSLSLNYDGALAQCKAIGGQLAEITNKNEQIILGNYVLSQVPSNMMLLDLWTGMAYSKWVSAMHELRTWMTIQAAYLFMLMNFASTINCQTV